MNLHTNAHNQPCLEKLENRTLMSASPLAIALDGVDTQVPTQTVTAGQSFTPTTGTATDLFPTSTGTTKWLRVKLFDTTSGKLQLTRTFYPAKDKTITISNIAENRASTYDVFCYDSQGDHIELEQAIITAAMPHELWFNQQPKVLDETTTVEVTVLDQYGNITTMADGSAVELHSWLPKNTPGAAPILTGDTEGVIINGVASFTGLMMNRTGQARLIARLGDLKPTVSNVFHPDLSFTLPPGPVPAL